MNTISCLILVATISLTNAPHLSAQTSAFVTTLGKDTLSVERYTRDGNRIAGDWVTFYGGITVHHYDMTLRPDGNVEHMHLTLRRRSGKVEEDVDLAFRADSITAVVAGEPTVSFAAKSGTFPTLGGCVAMLEAITTRLRQQNSDSATVTVFPATGPFRAGATRIQFIGTDSARMGPPVAATMLAVGRNGRVEGISRLATTTRSLTRRVEPFDLAQVIQRFPDIPAEAPILGFLGMSPRDTARATFGSTRILVDYGRPSLRGREVFSHGVLGDTLWRTGANAATQFTTTTDLLVGGKRIAAGTYTLWTRVSPDNASYQLVFNSQVGQWGTEHHVDRDVMSIPLAVRRVGSPTEQFSITMEPAATGAVLRFAWGRLELSTLIATE
ncbi:MAG: DUF2911 domain-containing protein [bacterium]